MLSLPSIVVVVMEKLQEGSVLHQATEAAVEMFSESGSAVVDDITSVIIDQGAPDTAHKLSELLCIEEVRAVSLLCSSV